MFVTNNEVQICKAVERFLGSEGERVWKDEMVTLGLYVEGRNNEAVTERVERFVRDVEKDGLFSRNSFYNFSGLRTISCALIIYHTFQF